MIAFRIANDTLTTISRDLREVIPKLHEHFNWLNDANALELLKPTMECLISRCESYSEVCLAHEVTLYVTECADFYERTLFVQLEVGQFGDLITCRTCLGYRGLVRP